MYQEEILWYQKSRSNWLNHGDRNTRYFHTTTIIRRRRNRVSGLKLPDGQWCYEDQMPRDHALSHFKNLYHDDSPAVWSYPTPGFPTLASDEIENLSLPVSEHEIHTAIFQMQPLKAPGPDGVHPLFFQKFWHIIGPAVTHFVQGVFMRYLLQLMKPL